MTDSDIQLFHGAAVRAFCAKPVGFIPAISVVWRIYPVQATTERRLTDCHHIMRAGNLDSSNTKASRQYKKTYGDAIKYIKSSLASKKMRLL